MGLCDICRTNESKYKCSRCLIPYCSLSCYKSPEHNHDGGIGPSETKQTNTQVQSAAPIITTGEKSSLDESYKSILKNVNFQYYLNHPVVQKELVRINQLIQSDHSQDFDKSNDYLLNLRKFGKKENVLIEEFCLLLTDLLEKEQQKL